jgi:hypothetical protein
MSAQNMEALSLASETYAAMAKIKRGVGDGSIDPVEVAQTCELPIKVYDLMRSIQGVGPTKARAVLTQLGLNEKHVLSNSRTKGRHPLTEEQRIRLAEHIAWRVTGSKRWRVAA